MSKYNLDPRIRRARKTRIRIAEQRATRLTVGRSNAHIYAQIIAPTGDKVLASASTLEADVRSRLVAAILQRLAHIGFERRSARKHFVTSRRNDLRINVRIRPADGEPRCALLRNANPRLPCTADSRVYVVLVAHLAAPAYFFFVSLITTRSPT